MCVHASVYVSVESLCVFISGVCVRGFMFHGTYVEVRGQLAGGSPLLQHMSPRIELVRLRGPCLHWLSLSP